MASLEGAIGGGRDRERAVGRVADVRGSRAARAITSWRAPSCTAAPTRCSTSRCAASASTPRSSPATTPRSTPPPSSRTPRWCTPRSSRNPSGSIADLTALADVAHAAGVPLVVDATLATPYLCRPIEHGADIVLHSATKFIGGHGTSIGGVVGRVGSVPVGQRGASRDDRARRLLRRAALLGELRRVRVLHEAAGRAAARLRRVHVAVQRVPLPAGSGDARRCGWSSTSRTRRRSRSSSPSHDRVSWVRYAGLPDSPFHERANHYLPKGPGAVFAFGVKGGRAAGQVFIESVELCSHLANVGDARTLVIHPGSTTHQQLSDEALAAAGVGAGPRPHLGRARGRRRHPLGPRPGARTGGASDVSAGSVSDWTPPTAASGSASFAHPNGRARRRVGEHRPAELLRRHLPGVVEHRLRGVLREPHGRRDPRAQGVPLARRAAGHRRSGRRVPQARRPPRGRRRSDRGTARRRSGSSSDCGATRRPRRGHEAGLDVVMNRCLKIEHARFHGGLHLAGFDTGVISSRRRPAEARA